jgi:multiple sugar transport system substrate-binding protein
MIVMEEITFSVLNHGTAALKRLQTLLIQFEQQNDIHVRLEIIQTWALGWSRLVENALYRSGPDISEAGNSWIGDLARMEALHPFGQEEVLDITKDAHLFENIWKNRIRDDSGKAMVYSIPWTGDTRAVFYRRDMLAKAGVDEATAFTDAVQFEKTLSTLQEKGISMPLALTSQRSSLTIHYIASWVWGAGGDFLNPDGIGLAFDQPRALEGCKDYFRLVAYLCPEARNLSEEQSNQAFRSGLAAVTLGGYWMLDIDEMSPDVYTNLGVAPMPGIPFVGGQDLVIWNHSHHESAAIKLIRFLHTDEAGKQLFPLYGLPIGESAWENPPFNTGFYPIFKTAIQEGRGFKGHLWGLVEKRLTDEFSDIWAEILKPPESSSDLIVDTKVKSLANRLRVTLGTNPA